MGKTPAKVKGKDRQKERGKEKSPLSHLTFGKRATSIRLDCTVLDFFKNSGPRWQSRINEVLRRFMEESTKQ